MTDMDEDDVVDERQREWDIQYRYQEAEVRRWQQEDVQVARANGISVRQAQRLRNIAAMGWDGEEQLACLEAAKRDPNW